MKATRPCRTCGAALSESTVEGLCPRCLVRLTLHQADEAPASPPNQTGDRRGSQTAGTRFGDYELHEEIARGGMGVVFKARQLSLQRMVALKMILAGRFASRESVLRFRAEAEAAAQLRHPNILPIYEVGEEEGHQFFAMEFVEGRNLAELVRDGPLAAERAARYVQLVAGAVQHAHEHGIIHRDLKPSNVLVDAFDQPRVTDFGLAKRVESGSELRGEGQGQAAGSPSPLSTQDPLNRLTLTGQVLGSPGFSSPEQTAGGNPATPASDIYSLGAILFHLLTGRPPFLSDTLEKTIAQVLTHEPVSPRLLNPSVPLDLATICLKCLEKEPSRRYAAARDVAEELTQFLEGRPIRARPISRAERAVRWCRRKPALAAMTGLAAVALASGFCGVMWQWGRAERHAHQADSERTRAERTLDSLQVQHAEVLAREDKAADAVSLLAHVLRREPKNRLPAERLWSLLSQRSFALPVAPPMHHAAALADASFSPDGRRVVTASRDGSAAVWDVESAQEIGQRLRHHGPVTCASFSPDGRWIATGSEDGTVKVWSLGAGDLVRTLEHSNAILSLEFSPDSQLLVSASADRAVRVWSVQTGQVKLGPLGHGSRVTAARFGAGGRRLVTASYTEGKVNVYDLVSAKRERQWRLNGWVFSARLSPDERRVVAALYQNSAKVLDVETGNELIHLPHESVVTDAAFSLDGEAVATVATGRRATLWDAQSGERVLPPLIHSTQLESLEFSPDGLRLVTRERGDTAYVWDLLAATRVVEPIRAGGTMHRVHFDPAGARVVTASQDGVAQVWDVRPGRMQPLSLPDRTPSRDARFSPDDRSILTFSYPGAAAIWDARTGEKRRTFRHENGVLAIKWSQDGRKVATGGWDYTASVWDAQTGQRICQVRHKERVGALDFSPDGRWLVTGSFDTTAQIWDAESGQPRLDSPLRLDGRIWHVEFSPDGGRVLAVSDGKLARVWDAQTGATRGDLRHDEPVWFGSFSPDGSRVATCSQHGTILIWDLSASRRVAEMRHNSTVRWAGFSRDGQRLVSASYDNTARVWDAHIGQALTEPLRHLDEVHWAAFSPDGHAVATASGDGTARVWDAATGRAISEPFRDATAVYQVTFDHAGKYLATSGRFVRIWELPPKAWLAPEWLPALAEGVAGQAVDATGRVNPISVDKVMTLKQQLHGSQPTNAWTQWARWFFADRSTRPLSPSHLMNVGEMARRLAETDAIEGCHEAIRLSPTNGLAWARLALGVMAQPESDNPHRQAQAILYSRRALNFSPREPDVWTTHARILETNGRVAEASSVLERAVNEQPQHRALWLAWAELLQQLGRLDESYAAFSRAIELSKDLPADRIAPLLVKRRSLALKLNRPEDAQRDWLRAMQVPARDEVVSTNCLDLSMFYNAALYQDWHGAMWPGNNLATLPTGRQTFGGVDFDVRGLIQLASPTLEKAAPGFPETVRGISLRQTGRRLHFLHAAGWGSYVPVGTRIGHYVVHYADGGQTELPLAVGENTASWHQPTNGTVSLPQATSVWTGTNARNAGIRLFLWTWENPRPEAEIASLHFISAMTEAAPFLVAITVEP